MTLPTPEQLSTALDNLHTDAVNGSKLYQDPPADVALRNGDAVPNLRKRLQAVTAAADQLGELEAARDAAALSAAQAALYDGPWLDTAAAVLADTALTYSAGIGQVTAGQFVRTRAEGFSYEVAASSATDHHITTAGGVKLYVLPGADGTINVRACGARGDWDNGTQSGTDDQPAFQLACDIAGASSTVAARVVVPLPYDGREYYLGSAVELGNNGPVEIHGPNPEARIIRKAGDDYAFVSHVTDWCGVFGLGVLGQGNDDPSTNGSQEFFPAIKVSKRFKCDVFVGWCGGPNYTGRSEFSKNGSGSKCYAVGLLSNNSGTNYSDIIVRAARCGGDAVYVDTEAGLRNQNGMRIFVRNSFQNTGYAVNLESAVRTKAIVACVQGGFHSGIARLGDTSCDVECWYAEHDVDTGFVFDGGQNIASLLYNPGLTNVAVLNNTNNRYIVHSPIRTDYSGYNSLTFDGVPLNLGNGLTFAQGEKLDLYATGTDDGSVVGLSNGSTASPLAATYTDQAVRWSRVGNQVHAEMTFAGTLTSAQSGTLSITGLSAIFGASLPSEGLLGYGHIRNLTTAASSKPCLIRRNSSDAAMVLKHADGTAAQMSNFCAAGEKFEARFSVSFSL